MTEDAVEIRETVRSRDGRWLRVTITDAAAFEAMRDALGDPVWLLGASWEIVTTNTFKYGRFVDAFAAWAEREDSASVRQTLDEAGVDVVEAGRPAEE